RSAGRSAGRSVVLDADALSSFEGDPGALFEMIRMTNGTGQKPHYRVVLTPHGGEFRRLFPDLEQAWNPPKGAAHGQRALAAGSSLSDVDNLQEAFGTNEEMAANRIAMPGKVEVVRAAAERSGAIVLLKGPDTVIATPSGDVDICSAAYDRAAPWLATAGAGDVLAGLITGLAARRPPLKSCVGEAAWLHVEAALAFGPGLIAEDLPEILPAVFRKLGL
ncbi:MAG TPA: hypothetical protein EYP31_10185, partial [Roseibacterium sp.]|nr:hypothetical protein [Roseibacterium sp.]